MGDIVQGTPAGGAYSSREEDNLQVGGNRGVEGDVRVFFRVDPLGRFGAASEYV